MEMQFLRLVSLHITWLEIEADTAGTEDATAPTVDNDGNIVYEWYEIDANASGNRN